MKSPYRDSLIQLFRIKPKDNQGRYRKEVLSKTAIELVSFLTPIILPVFILIAFYFFLVHIVHIC